jgi:hypothetical protein
MKKGKNKFKEKIRASCEELFAFALLLSSSFTLAQYASAG